MRTWPKLLTLAVGLVILVSVGGYLLSYRPFRSAPDLGRLPLLPRRSHVAPTIQARPGALPRPTFATQQALTPPLTQTVNLLLAGIDTRPDEFRSSRSAPQGREEPEFGGGRTDALLLVVLDRKSGHVGLVGIPRDLALSLPGEGMVRINTIYMHGVRGLQSAARPGGPQGGLKLLRQTIRHLLGLTVDHTVFVDHAGFERLVDAMGGVALRVICPIRDRFLDPRGPGGRLELKLEAGVRWVDGRTALMFARSRHGRGIVDRARRQQAVLVGIRDRLLQLGPRRASELLPTLKQAVYTDMRSVDLLRLLRQVLNIRRERIHGLVLDWRHADPTTLEDGRWVMIPRPEAIHQALTRLFEAGPPGFRRAETCKPMDAALARPATSTPASTPAAAPTSAPAAGR